MRLDSEFHELINEAMRACPSGPGQISGMFQQKMREVDILTKIREVGILTKSEG
jgi:hypothetical protein